MYTPHKENEGQRPHDHNDRYRKIIWYLIADVSGEIMLSEISQVVKDKYHMISPISGT